jgi:general secretion pathway protein H
MPVHDVIRNTEATCASDIVLAKPVDREQNFPRQSTRLCSRSGFTLLEVMVVVGIIAAVLAIGAPRLFRSSDSMRSSIRKIATMTREIRNVSRLFNQTGRLVISMNDEKGHSIWVESAAGMAPLLTEDQEEEMERLTDIQKEGEAKNLKKFAPEPRVLKEPLRLPRGLFFESVELGSRSEEFTSGTAYIHFFPRGLAEEAAIHLTDRKTLNWTIAINPLTGRADVFERKISLKELKQ